jgi:Arc/MetJ-type ribon-helix-helix transcriptional regulator
MEQYNETKVVIPPEMVKKLGAKMGDSGFNSVSEYVIYILNKVIIKLDSEKEEEKVLSEEQEEKLKENLRALGYLE